MNLSELHRPLTEAQWQQQVIDLAHALQWKHLHVRRSIGKGRKWTTATNVSGWPDLYLWHDRHGFAALELKSETGEATPEQLDVLAQLERAGARVMVARPSDLPAVQRLLTDPSTVEAA